MKQFKRLDIVGEGFDLSLTIKDHLIVNLINKYPEDKLKFCLNSVVNNFAQIIVDLEEQGFDSTIDQKSRVITTYLAGPMEFAKNQGAKWRVYITKLLTELNILVLNPCKIEVKDTGKSVKENIDDVIQAKATEDWSTLLDIMSPAQDRDYVCVEESDFIIVYLDHKSGPGGTYFEIKHAIDLGIPVYGVCLKGLENENSWVIASILRAGGSIFQSFEEVVDYIKINYKNERPD